MSEPPRPVLGALTAAAWLLSVMGVLFVLLVTAPATLGLSLLLGLSLSALIGQYVRRQILQGPGLCAELLPSSDPQDLGAGSRAPLPKGAKTGDFLRHSAICVFGFYGLLLLASSLASAMPPLGLVLPIWVFVTGRAAWRALKATDRRDPAALRFGYEWGLLLVGSAAAGLTVAIGGSMLS